MPVNFPPVPVYPDALDSDYTLFLVYNTTETVITADNQPWAGEISIRPVRSDQEDIWGDNGFANISGELLYYDSVEKNAYGKVITLKDCVRNLGGDETIFNIENTDIRSYVIAEHHNQLALGIIQVEEYLGGVCDEEDNLICCLDELDVDDCPDDGGCPEIQFAYQVVSVDTCEGVLIEYQVNVDGEFSEFRIDFGDGTTTSTAADGQKLYPTGETFNSVDPIITVKTPTCEIVQSAAQRTEELEPEVPPPDENVIIPIPSIDIPPFDLPPVSIPEPPPLPPIVLPPIEIEGGFGVSIPSFNIDINVPSVISIIPPIPSVISITPEIPTTISLIGDIPSVISIVPPLDIPSVISFVPSLDIPSVISFGPVDIPSIISFGPVDIPSVISFGPVDIPSEIAFGSVNIPSEIRVVDNLPSVISVVDSIPSTISAEVSVSVDVDVTVSVSHDIPTTISVKDGLSYTISVLDGIPSVVQVSGLVSGKGTISVYSGLSYTISVKDGLSYTLSVNDNIPNPIIVQDNLPDVISLVGCDLPSVISIEGCCDFPSAISIEWGSPPIISCEVTCQCSSATGGGGAAMQPFMRKLVEDGYYDFDEDIALAQPGVGVDYDITGIPSRIQLEVPKISPVQLEHDLPTKITLDSPTIPSIIDVRGVERMPSEIQVQVPSEWPMIQVDASSLPNNLPVEWGDAPRILSIDAANVPTVIQVEHDIPSVIEVEGMVSTISVEGIPDHIPLRVENPEDLTFVVEPAEVKIQLDTSKLMSEGEDGQYCFALVPCKP